MEKNMITSKIDQVIQNGKDILTKQEKLPHIYDMPVITENDVKQLNAQYKTWRLKYDDVLDELGKNGIMPSFSRVSQENEQCCMLVNVRDKDEQYRNLINAINKHIKELSELLATLK